MTDETRLLRLARAQTWHCPGCGRPGLIPGPRGGASQNVYCDLCGEGWNFHGVDYGVIAVEPIGKPNPEVVKMYRDMLEDRERVVLHKLGPECEQNTDATFRLAKVEGVRCIIFEPCNTRSFHPRDIAEQYCARCHRWIMKEKEQKP